MHPLRPQNSNNLDGYDCPTTCRHTCRPYAQHIIDCSQCLNQLVTTTLRINYNLMHRYRRLSTNRRHVTLRFRSILKHSIWNFLSTLTMHTMPSVNPYATTAFKTTPIMLGVNNMYQLLTHVDTTTLNTSPTQYSFYNIRTLHRSTRKYICTHPDSSTRFVSQFRT